MPAAFGATDRAKGLIFATLAGIALDTAEQGADDEKRYDNLHHALRTRELIGQAQRQSGVEVAQQARAAGRTSGG